MYIYIYIYIYTYTADLDALVQRFVFEDDHGRLKLFRMAKEYYEAMTVHMAANPHLVNGLGRDLDIVLEYVEVLSKVNNEGGFDFISKELDEFNSALAVQDFQAKEEGIFRDIDIFSEVYICIYM
jgi:hypothetical protein